MSKFVKCNCGSKMNPTISIHKVVVDDNPVMVYECICELCGKKTKEKLSMFDAYDSWNRMVRDGQ